MMLEYLTSSFEQVTKKLEEKRCEVNNNVLEGILRGEESLSYWQFYGNHEKPFKQRKVTVKSKRYKAVERYFCEKIIVSFY